MRRSIIPLFLVTPLVLAATLSVGAHDFWLVPDAFAVSGPSDIVVRGRRAARFRQASRPSRWSV
jgi:hypothetical protein